MSGFSRAATNCDAISLRIDSVDDAYTMSQSAYMAKMPFAFLSDSAEALEMALFYCNGRAIVDSRSELDDDVLRTLAAGYGAVVR